MTDEKEKIAYEEYFRLKRKLWIETTVVIMGHAAPNLAAPDAARVAASFADAAVKEFQTRFRGV